MSDPEVGVRKVTVMVIYIYVKLLQKGSAGWGERIPFRSCAFPTAMVDLFLSFFPVLSKGCLNDLQP